MASPDRESITLYHFEDESIRIDIVARFDGNDLVIDGYDIGKKVAEYFGDSDYEYVLTIRHEHIIHLTAALDINTGNPSDLLTALATKFTGNHCFSQLQTFLEVNNIKHESFSWRQYHISKSSIRILDSHSLDAVFQFFRTQFLAT